MVWMSHFTKSSRIRRHLDLDSAEFLAIYLGYLDYWNSLLYGITYGMVLLWYYYGIMVLLNYGILKYYQKKEMSIFWHIKRGNGVQRLLMKGRINGRRGRGWPRTMWTDNIKEWPRISYNDCIRVAQDRERWRSTTADLLTTDGT